MGGGRKSKGEKRRKNKEWRENKENSTRVLL